ncbi:MAG: hypothetical protein AAB663_02200 [Patescibacteria group bacterium]
MLESQDILYIVLAFCALWFTAFLCWLMYQVVAIVRHAHEVLSAAERKLDLLERSVTNIKAKFESGAGMFMTVADGLKRLVDLVRRDRSE